MATKKARKLECKRCGHDWISKLGRDPHFCPLCKNPNWNRPRGKRAKRAIA